MNELDEVKQENVEIKESDSFQWWKQKCSDMGDERDGARKEMYEAKENLREENKMYQEEESEMRRKSEDVDRLRRARNEWREYYDELTPGVRKNMTMENTRATLNPNPVSQPPLPHTSTGQKYPGKKQKKLMFRIGREYINWNFGNPSYVVAAGDLDHDAWRSWIAPTFALNPDIDIDGVLASSGDLRFNSIDVASGLMTMMQRGGEHARIKHFVTFSTLVMMTLRNSSHTMERRILECMRPADVPNEIALRNILYDQVKGSKLMAFDLHYSESKQVSHAEKTYQYLIGMMSIHRG